MATIYRKTAKGLEEIRTRAWRLSPRLRITLILVDGQRGDEVLAQLVPLDTLAWLAQQGFVEAGGVAPAAPLRSPVVSSAQSPAVAAATTPASPDFLKRRRDAVRQLNELVGPAAQTLAIRMERAADGDALGPLLATAQLIISSVRGPQAAQDFMARLNVPPAA